MKKYLSIILAVALVSWVLPTMAFAQPTVKLIPDYAQRVLKIGDVFQWVRMHVVLDGAENLLSYGVKLDFAEGSVKFDSSPYRSYDVWDMGIWPYESTGSIYFFGGNSEPVSGDDILLGWVMFQLQGCPADLPKKVPILVSLAKGDPFHNFVDASGVVKDGDVTFVDAEVCIVLEDACEGDFDGDDKVFPNDLLVFKAAYPSIFPAVNYNPAPDFNADGRVFPNDLLVFKADYPRMDCPSCP